MTFFWVAIGYLVVLMTISFTKSFLVKGQEDFMVAGRKVSSLRLVGTLLCTWIGSGSLLAGAGLAARVGFGALWMAAGAWIAIAIIIFLAAKVRHIAKYTLPDILELRYNKWARILGTIVIIIAYTTIAGYQFRAGGFVLDLVAGIPEWQGVLLTAGFMIIFTAFAGMMSIVAVDIINGALITLAVIIAVPVVFINIGGAEHLVATLDSSHFQLFGDNNFFWAMGIFLPPFFLLLGDSNIYSRFFSARNEKAAKKAVVGWVVGTIIVETALASLAIFAFSHFNALPESSDLFLSEGESERIILHTARYSVEVGLPLIGGLLLLCASMAIIVSTGNSFLLTPSSNVTRDIYQRFINPNASMKFLVTFQRIIILLLGLLAYLLLTQFETILAMALTAYTMIGAGLTPALLATFLWRRVTVPGGIASIATGMGVTLLITITNSILVHFTGEPLITEEYIILPAATCSILVLIIVSLSTPPDPKEKWEKFYATDVSLKEALEETKENTQ
ncbi:MAG: sodium:solute symporter family protein [Bacteroidales bacterium]|nr:sodium:solute symporter family protein [Bacteroidales bacterium]